jgi:hypothetical protein
LLAVVDILQDISGTLHFVDILQVIARKLGETFGLDRCERPCSFRMPPTIPT